MKKQNIFQKLASFVSGKSKSINFVSTPNGGFSGMESIFDSFNLRNFKESLYLFIGVSMIRESVSSIPLEMYQITAKDGEVKEIYDDPFLDLLERPNATQTQKEFWKLSIAYYLLAGEAFWYLEREEGKIPTAMVNMRPDAVTVLFTKDKREVLGYEFNQSNGEVIAIKKEDVLHIKNIDPTNPARGVGVVTPATQRIVTEREASKHQSMTFKTQGRPDIAVFTEADLTEEAIDDARERWHKTFGADKGSQVAFFGGQTKDMKILNTNPKDMDFMETMRFLRDDILAALRIPKAMITSDDVNLANSKTARINYMKEAVLPLLDVFIDVINNKFLNDMDQDRFITYENPVNEDREMLLKEATELKDKGIITINEARSLMSYDDIADGDALAPGAAPTLQMALKRKKLKKYARSLLRKRPILMKKFDAINAITDLLEKEKAVKRERNSVFHTVELKEAYIKAFNKNIDNKAKIFKQTIDVYNQGFEKRIMEYIEKFGVSATTFFDVSTELNISRDIFDPLMATMFAKQGQQTMDNMAQGFSSKAAENFKTPEAMIRALELRSEFFRSSMLNTDYDELKTIMVNAMANGDGVEVIGRNLRQYFTDMSVARAKTIARTETGRLVSQATEEAYKQSELVTGKEWLTAGDGKVRDEHVANAGVIVDTNGVFPSGEHYPGESSINCRCALAPAV